jgi:hypothetical protein
MIRSPEIIEGGEFYNVMYNTIINNNIKKIIEIGSGSGNGSTQCFIKALSKISNNNDIHLHCFEPVYEWFTHLVANTSSFDWITCYNKSAICFDDLLVKNYDLDFWESEFNNVKYIESEKEVRRQWYNKDLPYFQKENFSELPNIEADAILIDGCEFSGYSEYIKMHPSIKWIFLDDCFAAFKTRQIYTELKNNKSVELIGHGLERNGWAIFKR